MKSDSKILSSQIFLAVLSCLCLLSGCHTAKPKLGDLSEVKWGHLDTGALALSPDLPMFLINKKPGVMYRICLAESLADEFIGIENEIDAAVNIWAYYLGRRIPVEILKKPLPPIASLEDLNALMSDFTSRCGENFDLIMASAPLTGEVLGQTSFNYTYRPLADSQIEILGYSRYLFIRDLTASPLLHKSTVSFESFQAATGENLGASDLLEKLKARDSHHYAVHGNKLILPVLIHEFGHIWGLCDQYEGPANCDEAFASSHLEPGSQMGASDWRQILYLTDDDITGIRHFLKRGGFDHGFVPEAGLTIAASPIRLSEPFEYVEVQSARLDESGKLVISYSVMTHVATEISFSIFEANSQRWLNLEPMPISEPEGLNRPKGVMNVMLGENFKPAQVRMTLSAPHETPVLSHVTEIAVTD